jgi:type I restriction enzyme S subunit
MTLGSETAGWRTVRFDEVARHVKDRVQPEASGLERYVAGEHMDTDDLRIRRWGTIGSGYLGPAFHMRFRAGQVLYGSRRTYLRKVAVPDFDGICANTTFVLEPRTSDVLPEFLPLLMSTDSFHAHSIEQSKGSVNPYINYRDIAWYEFALPPIEEQRRVVADMRAFDQLTEDLERVAAMSSALRLSIANEVFDAASVPRVHLTDLVRRPIQYGVLKPGPEYRGGVRCIDVKDYPDGRLVVDTVRLIDPAIDAQFERSRVATGDILVSIRGTIGRVTTVPAELDGANISRDSARVSLIDSVEPSYVRIVLEGRAAQAEMRGKVVGLAVKGINIADLRRVTVPLPVLEDQRELAARSEGARELGNRATQSLASLRVLRRAFLAHALEGASLVR